MVCGIDTYHDSKVKSKSVAAFVTSTDPDITKWFSQVFIHSTHQEVLDGVQHAMIQALYKYNKVRRSYCYRWYDSSLINLSSKQSELKILENSS